MEWEEAEREGKTRGIGGSGKGKDVNWRYVRERGAISWGGGYVKGT